MSDSSDIGVEIRLYLGPDQIDAVLSVEDDMCKEADEGVGHLRVCNPLATPMGSKSKNMLVRGFSTHGYFIEPHPGFWQIH
jgi:hypothetical protein